MHPNVDCPKCGRSLPADGEITFPGISDVAIPAYSCPECITRTIFLGQELELPLTFIIGLNGKPMDPADPEGTIDLDKKKGGGSLF